jgi:hypothetical protein
MNVGDLKTFLEDLDDDLEVRFASQPAWPFEYDIQDIQIVDLNENSTDEEIEDEEDKSPYDVVYLIEGSQLGYLPSIVKDIIGW